MADCFNVKISLKDLDIFNNMVELLKEITADERISKDVREEYRNKILALSINTCCPHCNSNQSLTIEQYKELEQAEKVVVNCNHCDRLYVVRYNDEGNMFSHE